MQQQETAEATKAIGMMLRAFPSSQSTITADSARVYLFAVEDFPLDAVKRACRAFVRGDVEGRNHSFAPSAPELAQVAKEQEGKIRVEQFEASHQFVLEGSDLWKKLEMLKNDTFPSSLRSGGRGWHFKHADVAEASQLALPAPISPEQQAATRARVRKLLGTKFDLGAPDAERDMGMSGAA